MITCGFFDSVENDRTYSAETFNTFFEGLIPSHGVFMNVDEGFEVNATTGMNISIGRGKAIVNNHWVRSNAVETITINPAHNLLGRYDMISLRWKSTDRLVSITTTMGTPSSSPNKPTPTQVPLSEYEIALAYVYVGPNATTINNVDIYDVRHDTSLCGIITGLIDQVDISTIYNQYVARFNELNTEMISMQAQLTNEMTQWQEQQKTNFDTWMSSLTDNLIIKTYIERKQSSLTITNERYYVTIPKELNYFPEMSILNVYLNGVLCVENLDYIIEMNVIDMTYMVKFLDNLQASDEVSQIVTLHCYNSKIGYNGNII